MAKRLIVALDVLEQGDWALAHEIAPGDGSPGAAWLHAHLHRAGGERENAAYWYRQAGRAVFEGSEEAERAALRRTLRG